VVCTPPHERVGKINALFSPQARYPAPGSRELYTHLQWRANLIRATSGVLPTLRVTAAGGETRARLGQDVLGRAGSQHQSTAPRARGRGAWHHAVRGPSMRSPGARLVLDSSRKRDGRGNVGGGWTANVSKALTSHRGTPLPHARRP